MNTVRSGDPRTLVFLLEELSARDALEGVLPKIVPHDVRCRYLGFEGKSDLEKQMVRKMRGWITPRTRFVVMRDQDSGDCKKIKAILKKKCKEAGRDDALVRIVCRSLEAWFVGDWSAIASGLSDSRLAKHDRASKFRVPDRLGDPVQEIRQLVPAYQKRQGARSIAPHLDPNRNRSRSFQIFVSGVQRLVSEDW